MGGGETKNENLGPCTKLHQKCMVKSSGWPHQTERVNLLIKRKGFFAEILIFVKLNFCQKKEYIFTYTYISNKLGEIARMPYVL